MSTGLAFALLTFAGALVFGLGIYLADLAWTAIARRRRRGAG